MEITGYDLYELPPRWLFLKIETDEGLVGWGEPIVEGRAKTVKTAVSEMLDGYLVGEDPLRIEDHWQALYRSGFYRGGPILMSAIAGIDQALWDIKGKYYDAPVYELLGGKSRDKIRVYQWVGGDRPADVVEEANRLVETGYTALKMDATNQTRHIETAASIERVVDRIRKVREAVDDTVDIGVDFRGRVSKSMAKTLTNRLADLDLMFVEEPVLPENVEHLPAIADQSPVPIATGERLYSRWDFKELFRGGAVDLIQPVVSHAGGISEMAKLATMAEAFDVGVAPNCPLGPIALAASLQVDTYIPNLVVQDHGFDIHSPDLGPAYDYLEDPNVFNFDDGYLDTLDDPGLGITIDEETIESRSQAHVEWQNPTWRNEDGSITDW
ncbi:mandelate racemase/muconate lactonizing family protein / galactonate dehydratase [Haloferax elongans ATCC BAA-1513]|uniref:Mandelate racemase/muconate lactonizing family protein / galactonate dehydratase n=1 Tax=Haloferax elongans ATCC BAA-1513 TaxID=1230453 RepID=M0HDQ1_HALEO|nr:galactonate dehydratase [Haloferax elongans]ELZ81923.1 mandelate racemase/muconate lactonizing family protein / galactonate dehydratase [Haloferax elongans ATCC BAA-1513]